MQQVHWMRNEDGDEIRVSDSQVELFKERGFEPFDKPAPPAPRVTRQPGRQMNMREVVQLEKGSNKCLADPRQIDAMKEAGWKVSKVQPEKEQEPEHAFMLISKPPVLGKVRLVHPKNGNFCHANESQVAGLKAAGWVDPEDAAIDEEKTRGMQNGMQLSGPSIVVEDEAYTVHIEQQIQQPTGATAAGVQFSNAPEGPWLTAMAPGYGGMVQAAPVQYDEQAASWDYPGVVSLDSAYIRVGTWPDQNLFGDPLRVTNAIEILARVRSEQSDEPTDRS